MPATWTTATHWNSATRCQDAGCGPMRKTVSSSSTRGPLPTNPEQELMDVCLLTTSLLIWLNSSYFVDIRI